MVRGAHRTCSLNPSDIVPDAILERHCSPCLPNNFFVPRLVEETDDLARDVLPTGLLVVHDTSGGGQDDVAELTRGQQSNSPLLKVGQLDVVAGRDDTSLVETAVELDNDLAGAVVIDLLELANVSWRQDCQ